jgi:hypothetical protein
MINEYTRKKQKKNFHSLFLVGVVRAGKVVEFEDVEELPRTSKQKTQQGMK